MPKILAMPAGGSSRVLYKDGSWNVAYANPGSYYYTGVSVYGGTLYSDYFRLNSYANAVPVIGTAQPVDLTNVNSVKFKLKKTGSSYACLAADVNMELSSSAALNNVTVNDADYTEYFLDVSALTGNHYIAIYMTNGTGATVDVKQIELIS